MAVFFIKKLFEKENDESVHRQFIRFSKGKFENKAVLNVKRNGNIKISGTYEIATDMISLISMLAPMIKVSGTVISREKIQGFPEGKEKKGVIHYEINETIDSKRLSEIAFKSMYCLLDCEAAGIEMKTKKTVPRPNPKATDKVKDKFFTAVLDIKFWNQIRNEFLFNLPEGKKFRLLHNYDINQVILPKNEKDYEKIRIIAKKKGRLTRNVEIDGKNVVQETEFEA
jgi:hypothetical protein